MSSDSKLSLDVEGKTGDSSVMLAQPYHLYIERVDPKRNMARFYLLTIEPTFFGTPRLVRRSGRIGTAGQAKVHHFEHEKEAVCLFLDLLRIRRARGYRPKAIQKTAGDY